ncbi:hypothetical protein [Massilia sp. UYP11]
MRITIGDVRTWTISQAQAKATTYKAQTDSGIDPCRHCMCGVPSRP